MKNQRQLVAWARKEIRRSKRFREKHEDEWRRYSDLYKGKHYDSSTEDDQLVVNLIFATVNVMLPAVAIHNPRFVVDARKPENSDQAILTEEVLNYLWRAHDYQRDFRLAVVDWIIAGHGWLKIGYKATKPAQEVKTDTAEKETDTEPDEGGEGDDYGIDDREPVEGNAESELLVDPDDDRPFVERISIFDMYLDPDARHPKEMRWVAQRTWRPVADVQVDERYSATQRKLVEASNWSRWDGDGEDARTDDDRPDKGRTGYVEVIEFYDLKRHTVSTFAYHSDSQGGTESGFLIKPARMPYAQGQPFVMLRNYEVPDSLYPIGDVAQIESLQLELNQTRTQMFNYRKKYRRGWVYAKDLFDRDGIAALESDEDNVVVGVLGDADPSRALAPIPAVPTPPEFWDQSAMIADDIDRVSGVSDYQRGNPQQNIKRTATEAAMIQDAANARAQDRLGKVEGILGEVGERIVLLLQQYMTGEKVARITTIPVRGWVPYTREHIMGKFDYSVVGGSTEPQNESFRRQSALQMTDVSMPFIQQGIVNAPALYAELLRKGFGIKDAERFVQLPPPPPELGGPPPDQMGGAPMPPEQMPMEGGAPMPPDMMGGAPMPPDMMGGAPMPPEQMPMDGIPPEMANAMGMGGPTQLTPEMLAQLKMMMAAEGGMPPEMMA